MENLGIKLKDSEKEKIAHLLVWEEASLITLLALDDFKNLSKMELADYGLNSTLIHKMKKLNLINYSIKEDKLSLTDTGQYAITKLNAITRLK